MIEIREPSENRKTSNDPPKKHTMGKRWKMVKDSTHPNQHRAFIATKISQFQSVVEKVKQIPYIKAKPYFERDYKDDGSEPFLIHYFISETFTWRIECTYNFEIVIEFGFENCPFELEIWAIIKANRLQEYAKPKAHKPSLAAYYKAVLAFQDPKYITKP